MRRAHIVVGLIICAFLMCAPKHAFSAQSQPSPDLITMNFQNVDIAVLAKFISEITGRNIVLDESVRGKVSIISPNKVTPAQAYRIFQSVLQLKGFTTVDAGPVTKIVPLRVVRQEAGLSRSGAPGPMQGDSYVTHLINLKHIDAGEVVSVIQPMVSHDGLVAAYPETNTLIITDSGWNIQRLLSVVMTLDAKGKQQQVEVIPLKLAYAEDLAPKIEQIVTDSGGSGAHRPVPGRGVAAPSAVGAAHGFKILPDERTNSLIVVGNAPQLEQVRDLVAKLDVHAPTATSRMHVYHLKYAQALEMLNVLNGLMGGSAPGQLAPQTGRGSFGRMGSIGSLGMMGGGLGGMGGGFGMGGMGGFGSGMGGFGMGGMGLGMMGMGMGGMMSSMGGSSPKAASIGTSTGGKHKGPSEFESDVRITADPATNSLVITAGPQDYETIQKIISELDIPRRQVFVQAVIAEVSAQHTQQIGINLQGGRGIGMGQINYGQLQNAIANPLGLSGLSMGLASGQKCSMPVSALSGGSSSSGSGILSALGSAASGGAAALASTVMVPCEMALLSALQQDAYSNVLSAPNLLTADNEMASIVVGQNVPFLSSAAANAGLPGAIFNSVARQNVGISLQIVPQITDDDYVKLDVYEEVSAVVPGTEGDRLGPTTTIRSASTAVQVKNHRTTVIGGLLSDQYNRSRTGIPFVSNIPVLGQLLSNKSRQRQKENLLVFLTPHIVRTKDDLRELSLDERQKFIDRLSRKDLKTVPAIQARELSKPGFSRSVTPAQELQSIPQVTMPGAQPLPADNEPPERIR